MTKATQFGKRSINIGAALTSLLLQIIFIIPYAVLKIIYNFIFGRRYSTSEYLKFDLSDFEGLQADRHEFKSKNNQTLVGYRYYLQSLKPKGVVVIAHGFSVGGQNGYMDVANYFVLNGYVVFAYDATGNDESGGKGIDGLPNGVIDLHYTLEYLKEINALKDLPVMLWGHSWGGYCVSCILNWHPEIKAVSAIAGFNCSSDMMEAKAVKFAGGLAKISMPIVKSIEKTKFGSYASASALDGFENSNAGIFIAHGDNDDVVPIAYGLDKYYKKYCDNPRFRFVRIANKGHTDILYSDGRNAYLEDFNKGADEFFCGRKPTDKEKAAYAKAKLNRTVYCDGLDKQLFSQIVDFYDSYLK